MISSRRKFLKSISFTGMTVVVAPTVLLSSSETVAATEVYTGPGLISQMEASSIVYYNDLRLKDLEKIMEDVVSSTIEEMQGIPEWRIYCGNTEINFLDREKKKIFKED